MTAKQERVTARIAKLTKEKQNQLDNNWIKSAEMTQRVIDALNTWL